MKEFVDYVFSFYGKGGIYDYGFKKPEIRKAMKLYEAFGSVEFVGDSVDREKIRDIVLMMRG